MDLLRIFNNMDLGSDGIYGVMGHSTAQSVEIKNRSEIAKNNHQDYLSVVPLNHSIPVMDREVEKFIKCIPQNGIILDLGGCWEWHWRKIGRLRPDLRVVIVDFVRENLFHAQEVLGNDINKNIFLVNGDATSLKFDSGIFDGVWTVQCFQHIPEYELAAQEASRVLKLGGAFATYSLNFQPQVKFLKEILNKKYVVADWIDNKFWLARASKAQKLQIETVFACHVTEYWSEFLFSPALKFRSPGRESSWLGTLDAFLTNKYGIFKWFARQHSFHCIKI